jgi:23S rRNA (uridine2552-2'-O)-methyltransferase
MANRGNHNTWLQRQRRDVYVKQAREAHYRSRAVYKLIEINRKVQLFKPGQKIIELGAAPGSWSQYISDRIGRQGKLIAVDILPIAPINRVCCIQGDITQNSVYEKCIQAMNNCKTDAIVSDMSPRLSGIIDRDQAGSLHLAELSFNLATSILKNGGDMLIKIFMGPDTDSYRKQLTDHFSRIKIHKPKASRAESRECYILARGFQC